MSNIKRVEQLERKASQHGRSLLVVIDPIYDCISVGCAASGWENISMEELQELRDRLQDNLIVVSIVDEQPQAAP